MDELEEALEDVVDNGDYDNSGDDFMGTPDEIAEDYKQAQDEYELDQIVEDIEEDNRDGNIQEELEEMADENLDETFENDEQN